jgi:transcriptional regulator with XRE-family HTH domain
MTPAETCALFGRRVLRERARRGWSVRETAAKAGGLTPSTINRTENGHQVWLISALAIADALDLPLAELLAELDCACPECQRIGTR